jgi:hypothetical protein
MAAAGAVARAGPDIDNHNIHAESVADDSTPLKMRRTIYHLDYSPADGRYVGYARALVSRLTRSASSPTAVTPIGEPSRIAH